MPLDENVITLRFTGRAVAYRALSGLRHLGSASAEVRGAVLVDRSGSGGVRVTDGMDGRAADALTAQVPPDGAVVLAEVGEADTETLDLLALWYGAVLERCPAGPARRAPESVTEAVGEARRKEAKDWRDRGRAEAMRKAAYAVAVLEQRSAA